MSKVTPCGGRGLSIFDDLRLLCLLYKKAELPCGICERLIPRARHSLGERPAILTPCGGGRVELGRFQERIANFASVVGLDDDNLVVALGSVRLVTSEQSHVAFAEKLFVGESFGGEFDGEWFHIGSKCSRWLLSWQV